MKKKSNYILLAIITITMVVFNFAFNIFNDAFNERVETINLSKTTKILELKFNEEKNFLDLANILRDLQKENIKISFPNHTEIFPPQIKDGLNKPMSPNIYVTNDASLFNYKIYKGRDITQEDILNKKKVVLISILHKNLIYKKDEVNFIDIDGESYEVIGIIKSNKGKSFYNDNIIMPYTAMPKSWNNNKLEQLSIHSFMVSNNIIETNILKDTTEFLNIRDFKIKTVDENLAYVKGDLHNFFIIAFASLLNIVLFSFYWIKCRKKTFFIFKALGYTNASIYKIIISEASRVILIGVLLSNLIYYFIDKNIGQYIGAMQMAWTYLMIFADLILGLIMLSIILFISLIILSSKKINIQINKNLKLSNNKLIKFLIVFQIFVMTINFITSFNIFNFYNVRVNKVNKIERSKSLFFTNSFSVSLDEDFISSINVEDLILDLKKHNIDVVNYLYDSTVLKDEDMGPPSEVLYINKELLSEKLLQGNYELSDSKDKNYIEVILGRNYKKSYKVNDMITSTTGETYKVKGFLGKETFYKNNMSSLPIHDLVELDNFIIIPYNNFKDITLTSLNYDNEENKGYMYSNILRNSIYVVNSKEDESYLKDKLKAYNITLLSKNYSIEDLAFGYIPLIYFKFIFAALTFLISLAGIISFVIIMILDNLKTMSIKLILGYTRLALSKSLLRKVLPLFLIGDLLTILIFMSDKYMKMEPVMFKFLLISLVLITIPTLIIVFKKLKSLKPSDLIKGD